MLNKEKLSEIYLHAEKGKYTQTREESVLNYIFQEIGEHNKYYVEFGAGEDGTFFPNTKHLLDDGWNGLLMDVNGNNENVKKEFVTAENINRHLA